MRKIILYLVLVSLIAIDQILKWVVINYLHSFGNFFEILINTKFIFGYGPNLDLFFWISIFIVLICAIIITPRETKENIAITLMLSGATSNLIDRFLRGGVVDYFKINFGQVIHFNLADLYLIIGLIFYLYQLGRENEKKSKHNFFRDR